MAAAKTRSKAAPKTTAGALAATSSTTQKTALKPEDKNPPKLFILPKGTAPEARIVSLVNPSTAGLSRYLCCPQKGFYEFTKVAAPKTTPRSWLLTPSNAELTAPGTVEKGEGRDGKVEDGEYNALEGYISKAAELLVATSIDPLFLILPALAPPTKSSAPPKRLFLEADDYLDSLATTSPQLRQLLRFDATKSLLQSRMAAVCDTVEAGEETMYRFNEDKLLQELFSKAERTVAHGLPASLEEKFVRKALQKPLLSLQRNESSAHDLAEDFEPQPTPVSTPNLADSQPTFESQSSSTSLSLDADATQPAPAALTPLDAPAEIAHLLRLRTALQYTLRSYTAPHLATSLIARLSQPRDTSNSSIDFAPLDTHLLHISSLRQEARVARSMGDYSRKRAADDDDDGYGGGETRAEKKRRLEEEEKKKRAGVSRGVRDLKKVDVSGMKKMSDFFKKK